MTNFELLTKNVETLARKFAEIQSITCDELSFALNFPMRYTLDEIEEAKNDWIKYLNSEVNENDKI